MAIELTEKAKNQLLNLNVDHQNFLRVWVEPGGCQGFSYKAAIDDQFEDGDSEIYADSQLRIVSNAGSIPYFDAVSVDYSDDLTKSGFKFVNKLAVSTCGCGSFKPSPEQEALANA